MTKRQTASEAATKRAVAKAAAAETRWQAAVKLATAKITAAPRPSAEDILRTRITIANSNRRGGDLRGNTRDRAARTTKLLVEFGDGKTCPCIYCGTELNDATLTQDKIVTGADGGRYIYANLIPACLSCNMKRSDMVVLEFIAEAEAAVKEAKKKLRS